MAAAVETAELRRQLTAIASASMANEAAEARAKWELQRLYHAEYEGEKKRLGEEMMAFSQRQRAADELEEDYPDGPPGTQRNRINI